MDETKDTQAKETLLQRLMGTLQDVEQPKKNAEGFNYPYAKLDQVVGIVTKACKAHGIMWRQGVVVDENAGFLLATNVTDGTGEITLDIRPFPRLTKSQDQGSAETYLRRYALLTAFGLAPEDEDDDGTRASVAVETEQQRVAEVEREQRGSKPAMSVDGMVKATADHLGVEADIVRQEVQNRTQGRAFEEIPEGSIRATLVQIWGEGITVMEVN